MAFLLLAAWMALAIHAQVPPPDFVTVYGQANNFFTNGIGTTAVTLNAPAGCATDPSFGYLYVCDMGNSRILRYEPGSTVATFVIGQPGVNIVVPPNPVLGSATTMSLPRDVVIDEDGGVYAADSGYHRVMYYPRHATAATIVYGQPNDVIIGNTSNPAIGLNEPSHVALDSTGSLFICDSGNHRIVSYPPQNPNTRLPLIIGQRSHTDVLPNSGGTASASSLSSPSGIAFDLQDNLWVADQGNNRIVMFPRGQNVASRVIGQTDFTGRDRGTGPNRLNGPEGVALDALASVYILDVVNNRLLRYDPESPATGASASAVWGQANFIATSAGLGPSQFNLPSAMTIDTAGNLYVVDFGNNRVLRAGNEQLNAVQPEGAQETFGDSAVVIASQTASMTGDMVVGGNLDVRGKLNVAEGARININGTLSVRRGLNVTFGSVIVASGALSVGIGATLTPVINFDAANMTSITMPIARFSSRAAGGTFVMRAAISTVNNPCVTLGPPSQDFAAGALSTTIAVTNTCTGTGTGGGGLSRGAIIGIAVGCAVAVSGQRCMLPSFMSMQAIVLVVLLALAVCHQRITTTARMAGELRGRELDNASSSPYKPMKDY